MRKSHVIRLLDGKAGLLERLTADQTSMSIFTADEIMGIAAQRGGAVIRGWGATHLLRQVPHAMCVRVCAPFETRKRRMMERVDSDDEAQVARRSARTTRRMARSCGAISTCNGPSRRTTTSCSTPSASRWRNVSPRCSRWCARRSSPRPRTRAWRSPTWRSPRRCAPRCAARPKRAGRAVAVSAESGRVTLSGAGSTDEMLAFVEVAAAVPGVRRRRVPDPSQLALKGL